MSNDGPTQIFSVPPSASPQPAVLDIIFVHGLGGHRLGTWQRTDDSFWPRWLAAQFPTCRVYTTGYDSDKFAGILAGEGASIQDLALILADQIASREECAPNALLIAHSLGGLVVKQMLRRCSDSTNRDFNSVSRSVIGVVFLGTPHVGAHAATALDILLRNFKSKQVKQLAYNDDSLIDLNEFFRTWVSRQDAAVRTYYETEKTYGVHIVDKVTANPGIVGSDPIAVQENHIDICKPISRSAPVYASICAMIRNLLNRKSLGLGAGAVGSTSSSGQCADARDDGIATAKTPAETAPEALADFAFYTTMAEHDRRDLAQKLTDAGRSYAIADAKRKKERFYMALQRHVAQPSAVTRYTRLLADIESRFSRHVARVVAERVDAAAIDRVVQEQVITPCTAAHSTSDNEITAAIVDGALYFLAGNCHLAWDNE